MKSAVEKVLEVVRNVLGMRGKEYESEGGEDSFQDIADMFYIASGKRFRLEEKDAIVFMQCVKLVRSGKAKYKHVDSVIDNVGYGVLMAAKVMDAEKAKIGEKPGCGYRPE